MYGLVLLTARCIPQSPLTTYLLRTTQPLPVTNSPAALPDN